jgi:hypothetical protein
MSPMHADRHAILDTSYIIAATCVNGDGPCDGEYVILCILGIGDDGEQAALRYPSAAERDTAFLAIAELVRANAGRSADPWRDPYAPESDT